MRARHIHDRFGGYRIFPGGVFTICVSDMKRAYRGLGPR